MSYLLSCEITDDQFWQFAITDCGKKNCGKCKDILQSFRHKFAKKFVFFLKLLRVNFTISWWAAFQPVDLYCSFWLIIYCVRHRADMHNIRPAGQMWLTEALNLARTANFFALLPCFFDRNTLWRRKNVSFLALEYCKNNFLARHEIWVVHPAPCTLHPGTEHRAYKSEVTSCCVN